MSTLSKTSLLILIMAMLISCTGVAPTSQTEDQSKLAQIISTWREQAQIPGVVVGISIAGQPDLVIASGEADIENHTPLKADDQFQIASISKTFIAAEILRLAERGRIKLDDQLNVYLPNTPYGDIVTIRHLLNHRSGYFDPVFDDPAFIPNATSRLEKYWTTTELLELTFKHDLYFEPGTEYRYSNTNYFLLGLVIEALTGQPLGEVLTTDLITPFELTQTFYRTLDTDISQTNFVHGYDQLYLSTQQPIDVLSVPNTAILSLSNNNIVASASDLLKWSRALYGENSSTLDPGSQKQMLTFDEVSDYGLGVYQSITPIGTSFGHSGETVGFLSLMEYFPKQDMSIVILVNKNASNINLANLRDLLLANLYKDELDNGIEKLVRDLKSDDATVRKNAISGLGHSGANSKEAVTGLIVVLKTDAVAENRKEAALALGLLGKGSEEAKQALRDALQDEDASVREAAQVALSVLE